MTVTSVPAGQAGKVAIVLDATGRQLVGEFYTLRHDRPPRVEGPANRSVATLSFDRREPSSYPG